MDVISLNRFMPLNAFITSPVENENTANRVRHNSVVRNSIVKDTTNDIVSEENGERRKSVAQRNSIVANNAAEEEANSKKITPAEMARQKAICKKISDPIMAGCEPDSDAAMELKEKFPELQLVDIVRFLVARKGNTRAAEEMIEKWKAWKSSYFPLKKADVQAAIETKCFFPFGQSKDGSPVVYMRGGLYDNTKATPEQYVLAAGHTIDYALKQYPDEVNVTVIVHTANIPGAPNQAADTTFIKLFIQVRHQKNTFTSITCCIFIVLIFIYT